MQPKQPNRPSERPPSASPSPTPSGFPTDTEETITSYLLSDLSPERAAQTRDLLDRDPALQDLAHDIADTLSLLDEAIAHDAGQMKPRLQVSERPTTPGRSERPAGTAAPRPLRLRREKATADRRPKSNILPLHILAHAAGLAFFFGFVYLLASDLNGPSSPAATPAEYTFTYKGEHAPVVRPTALASSAPATHTTPPPPPPPTPTATAPSAITPAAAAAVQRPLYDESLDPVVGLLDSYALAQADAEWDPYTRADWVQGIDLSERQSETFDTGALARDAFTFPTARHAFQLRHRTALALHSTLTGDQRRSLDRLAKEHSSVEGLLLRPSIQSELGLTPSQSADIRNAHVSSLPPTDWRTILNEGQRAQLDAWQ